MFAKIVAFIALFGLVIAELDHESVHHHAPQPYKFGYNIKDKDGEQYREETGDGHSGVKGSYGFTDAKGIKRHVDYVADHAGFRAQVRTNEPGTANQDPAAVKIISDAPYTGGVALGGLGYGYGGNGLGNGYGVAGYGGGYDQYGLGAGRLGGFGNSGLGAGRLGGFGNGGLGAGRLGGFGNGGLGLGVLGGLGYTRYGY